MVGKGVGERDREFKRRDRIMGDGGGERGGRCNRRGHYQGGWGGGWMRKYRKYRRMPKPYRTWAGTFPESVRST